MSVKSSSIDENASEFDVESSSRCQSPAPSKIASSADVSSIASFPEYDLVTNITVSELKSQLSELIKAKGPDLIQACKNFDRRLTNKIPKTQLRQVIRMFCFPISAAQFDYVCDELKVNTSGKINYHDFFNQLSGTKIPRISKKCEKLPNNLPIDEVELRIKEKIKENLRDIIRSFWLFDINKDGLIQKIELRRIIRNYCFDLSEDVFEDLWKSYDPKAVGVISYRDFLVRLGISADRYKRYMPPDTAANSMCWADKKARKAVLDKSCEQKCKRAALENKDDPAIQGLPLEEIIIIFVDRLHRRYQLLKNAFSLFDSEKNGKIPFSDFQGVINFFVLPMSSSLFNRVMGKLEIKVPMDKNLNYNSFLENYCKPDSDLPVTRESEKLDCAPIVQRIKNYVLNPEARLHSVFTKISPNEEWQITRPELKKALELGLDFKITDDEFKELTMILDPGNTNLISCVNFINLFEGPCDSICFGNDDDVATVKNKNLEKYKNLSNKKLITKLKHHLNKNFSNVEKAILVCDPNQSGFITKDKLQKVLSGFCFPLSNNQFQDVVSEVRKYGDSINYHEFLTLFKKKPDEDTKKWIGMVDKLVNYKSRCSPEIPVEEAAELLRDCLQFRKTAILKDFKALDVCNVGVVCKDDAKNILSKFSFRFTKKQFEELWQCFPRNKYDQLLYDEFLKQFALPITDPKKSEIGEKKSPKTDTTEAELSGKPKDEKATRRPGVRMAKDLKHKAVKSAENRKTSKEIFYSKAPELKSTFEAMEPTIIRNFRTIRFHLRRADPKVTDLVDFITLKSILAKSDIHFSKEDEFHILEYFDTHLTGKINYRDFLRMFVWYA